MTLHGGIIPYSGTFLVFSDYCRPSIRLAALMGERVIHVMTHDSIGLGEDGPTHQPVEHLAALRAIPNLLVIRPADGLETAAAWGLALEHRDGPTLLALTRQNLPALERPASFDARTLRRGGYVLREASNAALTFVATGSEVSLAVGAADTLAAAGHTARVVSMPAPDLFLAQDRAWRDAVLPPGGRRVSIEAASPMSWRRIVGDAGLIIGIDHFGESAPYQALAEHFGFTPDAVAKRVTEWLASASPGAAR